MATLYLKKNPEPNKTKHVFGKNKKLNQKQKRLISVIFFTFGIITLSSAIFPIIKFQFEYSRKFGQIINPLSTDFYNQKSSVFSSMTTDFTQLNNWFIDNPKDGQTVTTGNLATSIYTISIPKIKINNSLVYSDSMDLKKSLIQYPGTAVPGALGNPVIFGHSVLPQFFNPNSYLTTFSNLFKLNNGDEIFIDYDGIRYRYLVNDIFEVKPTDLSVLDQRFDDHYLTLVTCSPPGTYLRRLVVKALLSP